MAKTAAKVRTDESHVVAANGRARGEERPLRVDEAGVDRLRERLHAANRDNPDFEAQFAQLMGVVLRALEKLRTGFADDIELVVAIGGWARDGIDLRTLPEAEDVVLQIVIPADEEEFEFDMRLSEALYADVFNGAFLLQFTVLPLRLWERSLALPRNQGRADAVGIPLLTRA